MITTLKAIQNGFIPIQQHTLFHSRKLSNTKISIVCLSKSNDSESESPVPPEGDTRQQELLAKIAMLQTSKIRLTDYIDERSDYLSKFGEEANAEFDKIGEDALKGLDDATARIMANIEDRMQAFEETAEMSKQEIEKNEYKLAEFEGNIAKDKNEGLFFKNLGQQKPTIEKPKAKEEVKKNEAMTKDYAGSKTRRNIYIGLSGLLVTGIADSFIFSPDWKRVAVLGAILVPLVTQIVSEQSVLSEWEEKEEGLTKDNK